MKDLLEWARISPAKAQLRLNPIRLPKATLNKSLAARSSLFWAVCGVANPRHSGAMVVVCALQPIPNQGAHTREDLFSMALNAACRLGHVEDGKCLRD